MKFRDVMETTELTQKNNCHQVTRQAEGIPGHFSVVLEEPLDFFACTPKCTHIICFAHILEC